MTDELIIRDRGTEPGRTSADAERRSGEGGSPGTTRQAESKRKPQRHPRHGAEDTEQ